jgi:hypothetical protein
VQLTFPAPPQVLWNALPAGVEAIRGKGPFYDSLRGFVAFRTGVTFFSWGHNITATVSPTAGGTMLVIHVNLKVGVFDWGEGKRLANRFAAAVSQAAGTVALT